MGQFSGFDLNVKKWFTGLEADNSREYFSARRDFYEASIRDQLAAFMDELSQEFGGELKMFRQNRDIRFSRDKSPYKTNTYGVLRGAEGAAEGLYASISATGLVAGSGYYVMARDQLERYRDAVADRKHGPRLTELVAQARSEGLELWGESLTTAPRGFPRDHERIELLRRKNLTLGATLRFGRGIARDSALQFVSQSWHAAAPVTGWLDKHVGPSTLPVDQARRRR